MKIHVFDVDKLSRRVLNRTWPILAASCTLRLSPNLGFSCVFKRFAISLPFVLRRPREPQDDPQTAPRGAKSAARAPQASPRGGLGGHLGLIWRPRSPWRLPGAHSGPLGKRSGSLHGATVESNLKRMLDRLASTRKATQGSWALALASLALGSWALALGFTSGVFSSWVVAFCSGF